MARSGTSHLIRFAHESERYLASVLDFYEVRWEYEPRTFVVRIDETTGLPAEAFTPDFYLCEFDLYLELTTLEQRLVTRKNRKVRAVMAQHPDVRIKLLYRRDVDALVRRFGALVRT